jgi:hypothetical protein
MAKMIKINFEKGGELVATLLEDDAPVTCKLIWEALPVSEKILNTNISGQCLFCDYIPISGTLPTENLRHFGKGGDVATISPIEYIENTIKGYAPIYIVYGPKHLSPHQDLHKTPIKDDDDAVIHRFKKTLMETCRANIFAKIDDLETLNEIAARIRYNGMEGFTVARLQ